MDEEQLRALLKELLEELRAESHRPPATGMEGANVNKGKMPHGEDADPDGDGDDDSTPEGDTDHDYWDADGKPTPKLKSLIQEVMAGGVDGTPETDAGAATNSNPEPDKEEREDPDKETMKPYDPNEVRADKPRFAMPNGSYPIDNCHDVHSAAVLAHHSGTYSFEAIKAHVNKAKEALGCPDSVIPKSWNSITPRNFDAEKNSITVSGQVERRNLEVKDIKLRSNKDPENPDAPETFTIVGYAAVFNSLSENLGGFRERIQPGAFRSALSKGGTVALWNHDENYPLATAETGTLRLYEDKHGLRSEIDLDPNVSYARDLLYNVRSGRVSKMSFGFTTETDDWGEEDGQTVRTLTGIRRLLDVSPVTNPAYRQTEVAARALLKADEIRTRQAPLDDPATAAGHELLMLQAALIERGIEF